MAQERKRKDPPAGDVISNLPRHRPHRRSDKRAAAGGDTPPVRPGDAGTPAEVAPESPPARAGSARTARKDDAKSKARGAAGRPTRASAARKDSGKGKVAARSDAPAKGTAKSKARASAGGAAKSKARASAGGAAARKTTGTASRATKGPASRGATRSPRERIGATAGAKTRAAGFSPPKPPEPPPAATHERPGGPPSGTELIGTVVQAAGELAEIGLNLGTQAVKNAVKRLPRP